MEPADFANRTAVVTGAGSGLGAALAKAFAGAGARVALADLDLGNAEKVAAELRAGGATAQAFRVDAGDEASVRALAKETAAALGPCSVVCANVGVLQMGRLDERTRAELEWVLGVNVVGALETARAYLPQLREDPQHARILFTCSTSSLYAAQHLGIYTASKYALLGLAETLALELAPEGIGVTSLLPGPMATTHMASSGVAKPGGLAAGVGTEADIAAVSAGSDAENNEVITADHAVRNVLRDLAAGERYVFTHVAQREPVEARFAEILAAYERARD